MSFKKIQKGDYFEGVLSCDHITGYSHKCEKCGNHYQTERMIHIDKCQTCGHDKVAGPVPVKCSEVERTAMSKRDDENKKKKTSDGRQIEDFYKADEDKLSGKNWYCQKHKGYHG